jgi:ElaA protein
MSMRWHLKSWSELTRDELYALMVARQQVFVVEQSCPYLDADGADPDALHLWSEAAGESTSAPRDSPTPVLAYLRVFGPGVKGIEARLGRVLTTAPARRQGLGRTLVRRGIDVVRERFGACPIRIAAQKYLEPFYAELGFVAEGPDYLEDGIPHVDMVRSVQP